MVVQFGGLVIVLMVVQVHQDKQEIHIYLILKEHVIIQIFDLNKVQNIHKMLHIILLQHGIQIIHQELLILLVKKYTQKAVLYQDLSVLVMQVLDQMVVKIF